MKLTSIDLTNHLSHTSTRLEFDGARLVSLVGPNGAGKSALIESIKYVLYDDARGKTDDLVTLGQTDMAAAIEFDMAGSHYRAVRGRTTRAGGRSFLELHLLQGDGSWTPLTAEDIRTTQQLIRTLLGVDADTFSSSVFLGQGKAHRFAESTAAERKRVLGEVLGLSIYERAERLARDEATALDAKIAEKRARLAGLEDQLLDRPNVEDAMATAGARVTHLESLMTTLNAEREAAEKRLVELAAQLAAGEAAAAEVTRLEAELATIRKRWVAARDQRDAAGKVIAAAGATIAGADAVLYATARVPALAAVVDGFEAAERQAGELDRTIAEKRHSAQQARAAFDQGASAHRARYEAARATVDRLAAAVVKLQPVECPKCHEQIVVDQADMQGQLTTARREFRALEESAPKEPLAFARDSSAIVRLEAKRREIVVDRDALAAVRAELAEAQRVAARAEVIEQAHQMRATAVKHQSDAINDLEALDRDGRQGAATLAQAKATAAGQAPLRTERDARMVTVARIRTDLPQLAREHTGAIADVAQGRAKLDELDARQAERDAIATELDVLIVDVGRLRRLVAAFSVSGIPARIIESVLPELTRYAGELLHELRPGMELSIRAQRAKKDGKGIVEALDLVVRDDAGERALGMFSGGERMSVALALAVGLSRLVARRAGTALRTLVIDEPDGLDAEARRSFGHALQVLAHGGELERVVLVSHHEDLADVGDATYRVTKNGHGSVVEGASRQLRLATHAKALPHTCGQDVIWSTSTKTPVPGQTSLPSANGEGLPEPRVLHSVPDEDATLGEPETALDLGSCPFPGCSLAAEHPGDHAIAEDHEAEGHTYADTDLLPAP